MEAVKNIFGSRKTTPTTSEAVTDRKATPTVVADNGKSSSNVLTKRASRKDREQATEGIDDFFTPTLLWRDPFFDFMPVIRNFERDANMVLSKSSPGYEITEDDSKYQIAIDVPGVKAADMKVELEQNGRVLHLTGGRKISKKNETRETRFDKRFWIGDNIDTSKFTANLADGVLVVSAAKLPKQELKTLKISITEGPHDK